MIVGRYRWLLPRLVALLALVLTSACDDGVATSLGDNGNPNDTIPPSSAATLEIAFPALTFERPVGLQHADDGSNRLFVVEQHTGRIRVFNNIVTARTTSVFLQLSGVLTGPEEGLLGLAFHPNFTSNRYYYVYYGLGSPRRTRLSRFEADPANPDATLPGSELVMLEIEQPFANHNGGQIAFGPDGKLYVAVGDGGSVNDPDGNGQNLETLLGSILRLDVDIVAPYVPADNPFADNSEGYQEEIWAYGLRNPWRFSFDPTTGKLWAGDVGQGEREEIDIIEKGKNYGWSIMEGRICRPPTTGCNMDGLELPLWDYSHMGSGRSVTGGYVYRGNEVPDYVGWYIYADYVTGEVWGLHESGVGTAVNFLIEDTSLRISSFGLDEAGELYACAFDGKIYRFVASEE